MIPQSEISKIGINGIDLHYLDAGRGNPVILVHGSGATDYRTWLTVIDRFAERYHVIVPSLRYHYPNEWRGDGSDYSLITHAQDLAALIRVLGISPTHIVGSSVGATITLVLARDFPDLVRTLVLAEPSLPDWLLESEPAEDREVYLQNWSLTRKAAVAGNYAEAARLFADRVIGPGAFDRMAEPARQRIIDNARILTLPEAIFDGTQVTFSREDAQTITAPILLLRGDSSPKQFLRANDELAKSIPGVERELIPHAAHYLHGMNPQVFTDVVLDFLARH